MATNYRKAAHIMIDLETLDVTPTAVVLSIGATAFYFDKISGTPESFAKPVFVSEFSNNVEVLPQMLSGRSVSQDTLDWWTRQSMEAKTRIIHPKGAISAPDAALDNLDDWAAAQEGFDYIWCQGGSFDFPILTNFYRSRDRYPFWKFWQERDSRTIISMEDVDRDRIRKANELTHHDAVSDCKLQAIAMAQVMFSKHAV